jgi:hypothetical protein
VLRVGFGDFVMEHTFEKGVCGFWPKKRSEYEEYLELEEDYEQVKHYCNYCDVLVEGVTDLDLHMNSREHRANFDGPRYLDSSLLV